MKRPRPIQSVAAAPRFARSLTLVWMLLMAVLSLTPDRDDPDGYGFVWLVHVTPTLQQKLAHVVCYAMLAVGWWWTLQSIATLRRRTFAAVGLATAFGALMEVLQAFVPGRFGSPYDIALNAFGAAVGLALLFTVSRAARR